MRKLVGVRCVCVVLWMGGLYGCSGSQSPQPPRLKLAQHKVPAQIKQYFQYLPYYDVARFDQDTLQGLTSLELGVLRSQLYEQNGYDYKSLWRKHFYKEKYGFILHPEYHAVNLRAVDRKNDGILEEAIQKAWRAQHAYHSLPVYSGHIMKEVIQHKQNTRYFFSAEDEFPVAFESNEDVPNGLRAPRFSDEITQGQWDALMKGNLRVEDLDTQSRSYVYLVKYWPNTRLKYVIRYDAHSGMVSYQDARHFSLYDSEGVLRRSQYLSYGQGTFEYDYYYRSELHTQVYKVIEKLVQDNQLVQLSFFRLEPHVERVHVERVHKAATTFLFLDERGGLGLISEVQEKYIAES